MLAGKKLHQQKSRKTNQPNFTTLFTLFPRSICCCFWLDGSLVVVDLLTRHRKIQELPTLFDKLSALEAIGSSAVKKTWLFRRFWNYRWWFRLPPVEVGSLSHDLLGFFYIPGGAGFLPSTVCIGLSPLGTIHFGIVHESVAHEMIWNDI